MKSLARLEKFAVPLRLEEIQVDLQAQRLGGHIHYFPKIDSTNSYAYRLAEAGAPEGEVVIGEEQTQGKGRMGRQWVSPPYLNLYLSVILRPALPPVHAPQITLMAAVALAETVAHWLSAPPEIKWPNDILVGGKKLAGILTESSCDPDRIRFVILGIGANLNFDEERMSEALRQRATSLLSLTRRPVAREIFARRLIQNLDRCYGELEARGFSGLAQRWDRFFALRGKRVRIEMAGEPVTGKALGLDETGALILLVEKGERRKVIAGDVIPLDS